MELFGRQSNFIRKVQGVTAPCKHIKSRFPFLACPYSSRLSMCHLSLAINTMVNIFFLCAVSQSEDEWCRSQCVCPCVCVGACLFICIGWRRGWNLSGWCNRMVIEMLFWCTEPFSNCTALFLHSLNLNLSFPLSPHTQTDTHTHIDF